MPSSSSKRTASSRVPGHRVQIRNVISSDGRTIYADAQGDARQPALVFIHGYTLCAAVWDDLFTDPRLAGHFFLVRYDMRGHGRSAKPSEMEGYSSKLYADDFAAVCAAFGVKRPIVVPWSLGATVIADIAAYLPPSTLAGVAYLAPCPYVGPVMLNMGTPFILQLLATLASSDDALAQESALDTFATSCFADPESIDWKLKVFWRGMGTYVGREQRRLVTTREQDPAALFALAAGKAIDPSSSSNSNPNSIPIPPLPTLLQIGEKDAHIFPEKLEAELRPHFADLEVVVYKGRGHTLHVECQAEVVDRIIGFARRVFGDALRIPTLSAPFSDGEASPVSMVKSLSTTTEGDSFEEEGEEEVKVKHENGKHVSAGVRRRGSRTSASAATAGAATLLRAFNTVRYAIGSLFGSR